MIYIGWFLIIAGLLYNISIDGPKDFFNWGIYVGLVLLLIGLTERQSQLKKQVKQLQEQFGSINSK
ncbi:hypothetical protein [Paenibacillus shenyangensis]|uniref:hypothetical protein n=1 Tax=Paenibacillus sp. A9 TaxID=1284352 RepID=UPI0003638D31|nr:hypothetical protein [Paenibacillus sp. A9]